MADWLCCLGCAGNFFYEFVPGVTPERIEYVGHLYEANAFWAILAAAFTPIPYKVFTISAGVFSQYVSLETLILASALGRSARFFLVATCLWWFGPSVRNMLERHFEWITLGCLRCSWGAFLPLSCWRIEASIAMAIRVHFQRFSCYSGRYVRRINRHTLDRFAVGAGPRHTPDRVGSACRDATKAGG